MAIRKLAGFETSVQILSGAITGTFSDIFSVTMNAQGNKIDTTSFGDYPLETGVAGYRSADFSVQSRVGSDPIVWHLLDAWHSKCSSEYEIKVSPKSQCDSPGSEWTSTYGSKVILHNNYELQGVEWSSEYQSAQSATFSFVLSSLIGSGGGGTAPQQVLSFANAAAATAYYGGEPATGTVAIIGGDVKTWSGTAWA